MQKSIEQIYCTNQDLECEKCSSNNGPFISLSCDHSYCVICLSFMYAKHRKSDANENTVKCIKCEAITYLLSSHLEIVNKTFKERVIPSIEGQNQPTVSKNGYGLQYANTVNRKIKSQEHSFEHNITPSTAKCFYSKCESPSSRKKHPLKNCPLHLTYSEPITHICFTCDMQPLCLRCTSTKKHSFHDVKDVQKGLSLIREEVSYAQMQLGERIENIEVYGRRLEDRRQIIEDRAENVLEQIEISFENFIQKIRNKQAEVLQICKENFQEILASSGEQIELARNNLQNLRTYQQKFQFLERDIENIDFMSKWREIRNELSFLHSPGFEADIDSKVRFPANVFFRELEHLSNEVTKLNVNFKFSNLSRVGTADLENCRSESKFRKDQNKRTKTNFMSLNSSREKKIRKNTRTQEDERRLRTEKINIERDTKNSKMPAYITDYINKKAVKFSNQGSSCTLEISSPNFENSKMHSKLSKTISPDDINVKKKHNMAIIKERIERKTTQPSSKIKPNSSKKKKLQ